MTTPDPLATAGAALNVVKTWRELETQERVRGASEFRGTLLQDVREFSDKTNRVLALFSPWALETTFAGGLPDPPSFGRRVTDWFLERIGRPRAEETVPVRDAAALPRLSVALCADPPVLAGAVEEARPHIEQVRQSANAVIPPLAPATQVALENVLFLEERILVHASSVVRLAKHGGSPRSAEALVEAYLLAQLAGQTRTAHEHLRELLTEDARDVTGASSRRRLAQLKKEEKNNEKWRRDLAVMTLRKQADIIDEVLATPRE
jgi:hypothetical protein